MKKVWNVLRLVFYIPAVIAAIIALIAGMCALFFIIIAGIDEPIKNK